MGDQSRGDAKAKHANLVDHRAGKAAGETMSASTTGVSPVTRPGRPWYALGFSFLLSLVFSLWFASVIGRNLGLFFAGLVLVSILAPLLVVSEDALLRRVSLLIGIVAAIAVVWLSCVFNDSITLREWSRATLVLLIYAFAIAGLAVLLQRIRIPPAAVVILSLAWLSWPIWLAPALGRRESAERIVGVLVAANPTFAMQGALFQSFPVPWAQYRIAYQLTNIGDDIPYEMPTSVFWCVLLHGLIGLIAMLAAHWCWRADPGRPEHPPADQLSKST